MDAVRFSKDEDQTIREHYAEGLAVCAGFLSGRSREAVRLRARKLGMGRLRRLKDDRPEMTPATVKALNKFLGIHI